MERGRPLVYLHGVVPGKYVVVWPVYVVSDHTQDLSFTVVVDDAETLQPDLSVVEREEEAAARRVYVTTTARKRLHQRAFRERVLRAYREQCSMCRLRHQELLDAAHIIPDSEERGDPKVVNGLALCKIHHAAFDQHILGVQPDYEIVVRRDILREIDGPMLKYGLQELHGRRITAPRRAELRPDPELLELRYERFLKAG
jgi:putative restriction endonuclease